MGNGCAPRRIISTLAFCGDLGLYSRLPDASLVGGSESQTNVVPLRALRSRSTSLLDVQEFLLELQNALQQFISEETPRLRRPARASVQALQRGASETLSADRRVSDCIISTTTPRTWTSIRYRSRRRAGVAQPKFTPFRLPARYRRNHNCMNYRRFICGRSSLGP